MKVHEILLIPGAGYASATGTYTRGHEIPRISELDVVDKYLAYIADEFETCGVKYRVAQTRKPPGEVPHIIANTLVVECRVGWYKGNNGGPKDNCSAVGYSAGGTLLANDLVDVMREWGGLRVHGHRSAKVNMQFGNPDDSLILRLMPFMLNGPGTDEYLKHLDKLGRDIGRTIIDYVQTKLPAKAAQIYV